MNTQKFFLAGLLAVPLFSYSARPAHAQAKANAGDDTLTLKAQKATGQWGDKQGLKLEGTVAQPAHVIHPQLDVAAPKISVNFDDARQLKGVVATGGVAFKVSLAQKNAQPVRIEAKCDNATLDRGATQRVLTLNGGVDGWFQTGNGPRNQLRGQTVKITSQPESETAFVADIKGDAQGIRVDVPPPGNAAPNAKPVSITAQNAQLRQTKTGLDADVDGGANGVRVEIPPMPPKPGAPPLGAVVLTAQRASVRQADGAARLIGNAHAVSNTEGQAQFDVTADELILSRNAAGELNSLKNKGRAHIKLSLPPPAAVPAAGVTGADGKAPPAKNKFSVNYMEIDGDAATADLATKTLTVQGKVQGFYRLAPGSVANTGSAANAAPVNYKFSGDIVAVTYTPEAGSLVQSLKVIFNGTEGQQAVLELPGFDLSNF
jgi:hypothetical protein